MTYAVAAAVDVTAVVRDVTRTVAQLDVLGLRQVSLVLNVIQFCRVTQNPVRIKRYIKFYLRSRLNLHILQRVLKRSLRAIAAVIQIHIYMYMSRDHEEHLNIINNK